MHCPNATEIHGTLYGSWLCELPDGVQKSNPKSSSYVKVLKAWKKRILDCSIPREYPKINELLLQEIPWKIIDLKRILVILEIINSISSLKNEEISFVILIKLRTVCCVNKIYKITHHWEWSWIFAKPTAFHMKEFLVMMFYRTDFSWLGFFRGNFTWYYSIRAPSIKYICK